MPGIGPAVVCRRSVGQFPSVFYPPPGQPWLSTGLNLSLSLSLFLGPLSPLPSPPPLLGFLDDNLRKTNRELPVAAEGRDGPIKGNPAKIPLHLPPLLNVAPPDRRPQTPVWPRISVVNSSHSASVANRSWGTQRPLITPTRELFWREWRLPSTSPAP